MAQKKWRKKMAPEMAPYTPRPRHVHDASTGPSVNRVLLV
jgi:hypothetical protein